MRLAWFASHPVQYQAPLFAAIAQSGVDFTAFYYSRLGVTPFFDAQFGQTIQWDVPLLQGYRHIFLRNRAWQEGFHFWGFLNFSIGKELWKGRFDAVTINGWSYASDWLVVIAGSVLGIPVFLRSETPLNQELLKSSLRKRLKKIVLGWLLFPRISAFLYIGKENRDFYRHYGVPDDKLFFMPYAVDNHRFIASQKLSLRERSKRRKALGLGDADVAILYVGKLIPKKRPLELLQAYERITQSFIDQPKKKIFLFFVGEGELRPLLEDYARDRRLSGVRFVGFKNQMELPQWYALADIFILPSGIGETWGLVVNEAMCAGLPVLVSHLVGSAADLVRPGENGYLFRTGDVVDLARSLELVARDPLLRKKMGEQSLRIINEYSFSKDIQGLQSAVHSLHL